MTSHDAVKTIRKAFPSLDEMEIISALDSEVASEERRLQGTGARNQYAQAVETACNRILAWLKEADEYRVNIYDPTSIAQFVSSHRQACVWAVLRGQLMSQTAISH